MEEPIYGDEIFYTPDELREELDQRIEEPEEGGELDEIINIKERIKSEDIMPEIKPIDQIKEEEIGKELLDKYQVAVDTKTPLKFIIKENGRYISIKKYLKNKENTEELFPEMNKNFDINVENFIKVFYDANITKKNDFILGAINKLENLTGKLYDKEDLSRFKKKYQQEMKILNQKRENLIDFYGNINDINFSYSVEDANKNLIYNLTNREFDVLIDGYELSIDLGAYLFDKLRCTSQFIYIEYQNFSDVFYKIYEQCKDMNTVSELKKKIVDIDEDESGDELNRIILVMRHNLAGRTYFSVYNFDLINRKLNLSYYGNQLEISKRKLEDILPEIEYKKDKLTSLCGNFITPIKGFKDIKMYYLTLFDDLVGKFFYVKEEGQPRSLKTNLKYYFKNPIITVNSNIDYSISFYIDYQYSNYYQINFRSKVLDPNSLNEFILIMSKIITYYQDYDFEASLIYRTMRTPWPEGLGGDENKLGENVMIKKSKKIDALLDKAPEMFPKNIYSKKCTCPRQPIIVDEEDVEDWEKFEGIDNEKHNVLLFPPENSTQKSKKYHFVCPSLQYSKLYFLQNKGERSKYPILPCCKEQLTSEDRNIYYNYDSIRKNPTKFLDTKEDEKAKGGTKLKVFSKRANSNQLGVLSEEFSKFLNGFIPANYVRLGLNRNSPSSLLHCLFLASDHLKLIADNYDIKKFKTIVKFREAYCKKNITEREIMINNLRSGVLKGSGEGESFLTTLEPNYYEICAQEVYNMDKLCVKNILENDKKLLDSAYFYRLFESLFCLNIFVFVLENDVLVLEKPNHNLYHMREIREELPSLFLLRHKDRDYVYDVYEIIKFDSSKKTVGNHLMPKEMTIKMREYVEEYGFLSCQSNGESNYIIRENAYLNLNWNYLLKNYTLISQGINSQGRAYKITIRIYNGNLMTLFIPPAFPLNVKRSNIFVPSRVEECEKVLGKNYIVGRGGLWYKINDCPKGLFVACLDIEEDLDNENICINYEICKNFSKEEKINELKITQKNANIIKQLVFWLWCLSDLDEICEWLDLFFLKEDNRKKLDIYTRKEMLVELMFPTYIGTCEEGIEYLSNYIPEIFNNGKIRLYNQLYDSLKQFILNYINFMKGIDKKRIINSGLINMFGNYKDFTKYPYTVLLIGQEKFEEWENTKTIDRHNIYAVDDIDMKLKLSFPYTNNEGEIFMVQNNSINNLKLALVASKIWTKHKYNIGYEVLLTTIWPLFKNNDWINDFGYSQEDIISLAQEKTYNQDIETYREALDELTLNKILMPLEIENYSYRIHNNDSIDKSNIIKDKFCYDVWLFGNGGYAGMLKIL